mmetsp:Transcript_20836/g.30280  ORF Transcript_20836/g.30280 Transcript_20836/m.30280 type:complete len:204 (+) Transcript_20836:3272-3883(+)
MPAGYANPKRKLQGERYPSSDGPVRGKASGTHSKVQGNLPNNTPAVQGLGRDDPRPLRGSPQPGTVEFPAKVRRSVKPAVGKTYAQQNGTLRMSRPENRPVVNRPGLARDSGQNLADAARLLPGDSRRVSRASLAATRTAGPGNRIIGSSVQKGSSQPVAPLVNRGPDLRSNSHVKNSGLRRQGSIRSRIADRLDEMKKNQKR